MSRSENADSSALADRSVHVSIAYSVPSTRDPAISGLARIRHGLARRFRLAQSYLQRLKEFPRQLREWQESKKNQQEAFERFQYGKRKKLVIFLIPGIQRVTGGVLQIFSLHRLTREYYEGTETDSLICWLPGEGWPYHRFYGFDNNVTVFTLEMVLESCEPNCELMIHLPEFAAERFCKKFGWRRLALLRKSNGLAISLLNQNIEVMCGPAFIERLKETIPDLNCTVGHSAWASGAERRRLGIPLHFLPTWYYPDDAPWQPYESKQNLLIVSPDADPYRELVLGAIRGAFPELRVQVIWGLKYEQYVELERAAKWSITFGEGLDGYFYGPVLRGGVAFAVRNGTFDLPGLEEKRSIYSSYELMVNRIAEDIKALDSKDTYEAYNRSLRGPLEHEFGRELTSGALAAFYRGEWTLP